MSVQVIMRDGEAEYAVLPWADYQALLQAAGQAPAAVAETIQPGAARLDQLAALREAKGLSQADLARAAQVLPGQDGLLAQVYGAAFHDLLLLLAGLAVVTALAVLWLLERKGRAVSSPEQLAPQAGRRLS